MENSNKLQEASKTNIVTIKIDYPTCYKMQMALNNVLNYPLSEPVTNYRELRRLNNNLNYIILAVLQKSLAVAIKPYDLLEEEENYNNLDLPF
jgi:hypothetical protein